MKPVFRTVTRTQGNNAALKDLTVRPDGFDLEFVEVPVLVDAFRRMVRATEFDVCEMAAVTYLTAKAHGKPFTALPIFLVRGFHHQAIHVNVRSGIREPRDLEGRSVGVNRGYTVTTGVWARGILQDEYDIKLDRITWLRSGDEHVSEVELPKNVGSLPSGAGLEEQLIRGDVEAAVGLDMDHPDVSNLIPDPIESSFRALRETGLYPINHLIVVRDSALTEHPNLGVALLEAFAESKRRYVSALLAGVVSERTAADEMYLRVMQTLATDDPLPYGIEPNRPMLDRLIRHAVEQGIISRRPNMTELFPGDLLWRTA